LHEPSSKITQTLASSTFGNFSRLTAAPPVQTACYGENQRCAFAGLAVIIAMTILQGCVGTARTAGTQCAKPTLIPLDATHATMTVTVRIATNTAGAYLRYTPDGSTPTGGSSGNGMQIAAASGKVSFTVGSRERTLKAIAYKPGLADSPIAEGIYVYESPYR